MSTEERPLWIDGLLSTRLEVLVHCDYTHTHTNTEMLAGKNAQRIKWLEIVESSTDPESDLSTGM